MGRTSTQCRTSQISKIAIAICFCLLSKVGIAEQLIDRVVAEVNGDPITYSEVQDKVRKKVLVEISAYPATKEDEPFTIALQDSVNLKLILQKAEELELSIGEEDLETEIDKFIKRRNLTRAALIEALAQEGMSYDQYREDWRKQMIISQFQGREILPSVKITDKDVEIYYLQQTGASGESIRVTLRQLFIRVPSSGPGSIRKGKEDVVRRVYSELKDGLDFSKAVRVYSDSESGRDNGGIMAPVMLKELAPVFRKAIEGLDEMQFTAPVRAGSGVYFFYLERKEFSGNEEFRKLKGQLAQRLRQEQIGEQTMKWIENQRRRSEIKVIE